jgi:sec-independent protein translocase protein TatA
MPNIGPLEIAIVLVIVLVIFGPKRLPELGKSMGKGIREFKGSLTLVEDDEIPAKTEANSAEVSGEGATHQKA